jgi:nitroreductase/dihydropteridine reductase
MKSIIEALNWRYATDRFVSNTISEKTLNRIIEAARLSPSSMNFQPWRYISVESPELRQQIFEAGYQQKAIIEAPTLLVLTIPNTLTSVNVDHIIEATAQARNTEASTLSGYRKMLQGFVDKTEPDKFFDWSRRQAYISLGVLLLAAAQLEVDTSPMEGFEPEKVNQILGLTDYSAVTLIALGYRSTKDTHQNWPKVRFKIEEILEVR